MSEQALAVAEKGGAVAETGWGKDFRVSGDTVSLATNHLPEEQKSLVRWLYHYFRESGMTAPDLEADCSIDYSTLNRIWNDKYRAPGTGDRVDLEGICERIKRYRAMVERRLAANKSPFVETTVWTLMSGVMQRALDNGTFAFIFGSSQIGKTACEKEFQRRNNHGQTIYVLCPAGAGKKEFLLAVAKACGIRGNHPLPVLKERIANRLDKMTLLIFDEVHELLESYDRRTMVTCLSIIRQLQEQTRCGVVLCATNALRHEIEEGEFAPQLTQLRRRGLIELQLDDEASEADLNLIAQHYKLPPPSGKALEYVDVIATTMGLGQYCLMLAQASMNAAVRHVKMGWEHFVRAYEALQRLRVKGTTRAQREAELRLQERKAAKGGGR